MLLTYPGYFYFVYAGEHFKVFGFSNAQYDKWKKEKDQVIGQKYLILKDRWRLPEFENSVDKFLL